MRFWVGNCSNESAERRVRQQLCVLDPTLGCDGLGWLINLSRFLEIRAAPSKVGWMSSLLIRPGLPQNFHQFSTKPTPFSGHHLNSQRLKDDMQQSMSSLVILGRGPEKTSESNIVFAYVHTDSILILVTSDWRNRVLLPPMWIMILTHLRLALASSFKFDSVSPTLATGMHLTTVTGVANFTFCTKELPMTRVCFCRVWVRRICLKCEWVGSEPWWALS